ncbi:glycosyltransferase family 4 protein [Phyllobacterium sp. K27]
MYIAFYAPLKSPNHSVPSGDRAMARLLIRAMQMAGHRVVVASELRSFTRTPDPTSRSAIYSSAEQERHRLGKLWQQGGKPDLWFTYHPYYKAPDLLGPDLARMFGLPYITAEASYSERRSGDEWGEQQSHVVDGVRQAAVNICFTGRDEIGLEQLVPKERLKRLSPFIDIMAFSDEPTAVGTNQLVTVAMMRPGDKLESYRMLAASLALLNHIPWTLKVVGDGPASALVKACFARINQDRIEWVGQKQSHEVTKILYDSGVYVWPGFGEAYGIAYLEAQAAGLPVVAQAVAGVPEVVRNGVTGMLTPANDVAAFAKAIEHLHTNNERRYVMGNAARRFVLKEHSLELASKQLDLLLRAHTEQDR